MDVYQLKLEVLARIMQVDNAEVLSEIKSLLESPAYDFANDLSQEQLKSIEKGLRDIEEGKIFKAEEVLRQLRSRLDEAS